MLHASFADWVQTKTHSKQKQATNGWCLSAFDISQSPGGALQNCPSSLQRLTDKSLQGSGDDWMAYWTQLSRNMGQQVERKGIQSIQFNFMNTPPSTELNCPGIWDNQWKGSDLYRPSFPPTLISFYEHPSLWWMGWSWYFLVQEKDTSASKSWLASVKNIRYF